MATIAIISQKGGAGKTTLALRLAAVVQEAGTVSLVINTDPQATISQWAAWRGARQPEVLDSSRMPTAPRAAAEVADLVLIPCGPSEFDLSAIRTTDKIVQLLRKPALVVFIAGSLNAARIYEEAGELVDRYSTPPCRVIPPDHAAYRYVSVQGTTVTEAEPAVKAAEEVREFYK